MMTFEDNLLPNFDFNPEMKSLVCDHPNEIGYQYVCDRIFDWIETNKPKYISKIDPIEVNKFWDGYPISNHFEGIKTPI
jgi:hypothetical protein